ncbi:RsmB/NOP family class I SAM-dependent RNA methyltransferase [Arenibacterium halophilum]|uniref:RsmB/NOP family class I SAM-dependent RNA methyltransferase n=1 Tax=Arenibacterium halophilum TaxID=2583821 RepID=A0ABY2XCC3_9RHOB|nr:RsmB/NOP family class I SAM-dependent RNA methyltransferase [Arenibacterium halophilum]TMV14680.1 RsmB/NOP family class I SAM-dependent RNA methyltransferase [Arenibacterium halophilum]
MTPGARIQAAIECLDAIAGGAAAEQVLTGWARRSRFAGSKDRAAVRDHVFGVLRRWRSCAALGGGETGRALMLGALRQDDEAPESLFSGQGHAPAPLTPEELALGRPPAEGAEALDMPDWLWPRLGDDAAQTAAALRHRAGVHLRVNLIKADVDWAIESLKHSGITAVSHPASPTALEVVEGARALRNAPAYTDGLVELQDAASQAVVDRLNLRAGMRVLDLCAGGGGKTLAIAARCPEAQVFAHDIAPQRLNDLQPRAERAGAHVSVIATDKLAAAAPFDLVLCDVPCSGSGSWRRAPEGKWRLDAAALDRLRATQADILRQAMNFTTEGGTVAYATCSVLAEENSLLVQSVLSESSGWLMVDQAHWPVTQGTDGFYTAHLCRA